MTTIHRLSTIDIGSGSHEMPLGLDNNHRLSTISIARTIAAEKLGLDNNHRLSTILSIYIPTLNSWGLTTITA